MNNSNKYSLISIIDCEQLLKRGFADCSSFANEMYESLKWNINRLRKPYEWCDSLYYGPYRDNYILLKSDSKNEKEGWLSSKIMSSSEEIIYGKKEYKNRHTWQQFGIIPVVPYKYVSKVVKKTENEYYTLGSYPKERIVFKEEPRTIYGGVPGWIYAGSTFNEESFQKTEDKISLPSIVIEEDKLIIEDYSIFKTITSNGEEIRAIKYHNNWFKVAPVNWVKIDDCLVCTCALFESPIHMKNDYVQNDDIQSFDDTFLKWYIDNVFTRDLFKNVDYNLIKNQMIFSIGEDIDTKLREIERLKQIKANLILQQSEEHIIDIANRNITKLFEEDSKEQKVRPLHK